MTPRLTVTQGQIVRALVSCLSLDSDPGQPARGTVVVESIAAQPWASLTFTGERHCLVLRFAAAGGDLAGVNLDVPSTIVVVERAAWADAGDGVRLTVDLLAIATAR